MSTIRDEIRAILREELAAVLAAHAGAQVETVRIETSQDLNDFAKHLVDQMSKPKYAGKVKSGEVQFVLERAAPAPVQAPTIPARSLDAGPSKPAVPVLAKQLITEADLAGLAAGTVQVPGSARLTPLAKDEANRRGFRIERVEI